MSATHQPASPAPAHWLSLGRFGLVLAALIFAAYPEVVLGQQTFFFRDFGYFGYPLAFHHKQAFLRGEIPLWNPLSNCGLPFLAQWNTLVLYPGSLLYLLFPLSWSLGFFCLVHQWLAGLGMFWLARRWTGSPLAGAVAGTGYAFGGLLLNSLMWPNNIAALAWMPWVIGAGERAWREGGRALVAAALLGAVQMLAGAPEVILFTWVILGSLCASEFIVRWRDRPSTDAAAPPTKLILRFGLLVLWVAGLAAIQLLPFLDLLAHSQRGSQFAQGSWSMPPLGWANFLVPLLHTFAANQGVFFQYDQWWTSSYYITLPVFALGAVAVWRLRERRVWTLVALTLFSLLMALGKAGYLYVWLKSVAPQLGFLRYPIKFVVLAVFCLPLLGAFGMAWLQDRVTAGAGFDRKPLVTVWVAMLSLAGLALWVAWRFPMQYDDWAETWRSAAGRAVFLSLSLVLIAAIFRGAGRQRLLWELGLMSLLWLDAMTHVPRQNPVVPRAVYDPGLVKLDPQPRHGDSRVMISRDADMYFRVTSTTRGLHQYIGNRLGEFSDCNLLDEIPKVNGFYSLFLREAEEIRELLYDPTATTLDFRPILDFLGVSHVTSTTNAFEWTRRDTWMPFVTGGQKPVFVEDAKTLSAWFAPGFDPRRFVTLPASDQALCGEIGRAEVKILGTRFAAGKITIDLTAAAPGLVVISQAHHDAWQASVDGQPMPVLRADHAYQAIPVPRGARRVELTYVDKTFRLGGIVSVLTLLGMLGFWKGTQPAAPVDAPASADEPPTNNPASA